MIITIDGPAASGKGTLSKLIAKHYNLDYLDTGSLYRATALKLSREGKDPQNQTNTAKVAEQLSEADLCYPALRTDEIARIASIISEYPSVRLALLSYQRAFASSPPSGRGAVIEGRDIGTVVCPDAQIKLFIDASLEVRAKRRYEELRKRGEYTIFKDVCSQMIKRDSRDRKRAESPLVPAADAHLLDTTELNIEEVFSAACDLIGLFTLQT